MCSSAPWRLQRVELTTPRVFVCAGNPGQAGYYTPFVHSLHSLLGGSASVLAVSHLGMDGAGLCPRGKVGAPYAAAAAANAAQANKGPAGPRAGGAFT